MCLSDGQANGLSLNGHHSRCDNQNDNNNHNHEQKRSEILFGRRLLGVFLKKETRTETTAFIMGTLSQDHLGKQNGKCSLV